MRDASRQKAIARRLLRRARSAKSNDHHAVQRTTQNDKGLISMRIASVGTAYPPHRYSQAAITDALRNRWQDRMEEPRLLNRLHANCGVEFRNLVFSLDVYENLSGFGPTNDAGLTPAVEPGQQAITTTLHRAGLTPA